MMTTAYEPQVPGFLRLGLFDYNTKHCSHMFRAFFEKMHMTFGSDFQNISNRKYKQVPLFDQR